MEAATNPTLEGPSSDPTLFCTAFKKNRFYMFTKSVFNLHKLINYFDSFSLCLAYVLFTNDSKQKCILNYLSVDENLKILKVLTLIVTYLMKDRLRKILFRLLKLHVCY